MSYVEKERFRFVFRLDQFKFSKNMCTISIDTPTVETSSISIMIFLILCLGDVFLIHEIKEKLSY